MELSSAPMGEYQVLVSIDPLISRQFTGFEIDPDGVAELAEAMGAAEAIERRLRTNIELPRNLAINYVGKNLHSQWGKAQGLVYAPRKRFSSRKSNPADILVSPVAILNYLHGSDLDASKDNDLKLDGFIELEVERTTIHEISHFVDPSNDFEYNSNLSKRQIKKMRKGVRETYKAEAARHPSVIAEKEKLKQLLPNSRILARLKTARALYGATMIEEMGKGLGFNAAPAPLSIAGLTRTVKNWENYYLLLNEQLARLDVGIYEDLVHFCRAEIREEFRFPIKKASFIGNWALMANLNGTEIQKK
jgi:hypothetical protein